jgi:sulfur dioxygenase
MLNHIADIGSAGWIGEHRGLYILGRQTVADRQAKEVDHFVDVRPNEMGTQDSAGVRIDQCLKTVDRFIEPPGCVPAQYDSIFGKLLKLPNETLVYPAHDYKGDTVSTIGEEKQFNPRLKVGSVDEYVDLMNNLKLPNPKMMDVAVPANMHVGLHQDEIARKGWAVSAAEAVALHSRPDVAIVDLREKSERERHGTIPGSLHAPFPDLQENIRGGGMLHELAAATGKRIVFCCAFGERSAMAVQAAQDAGLETACHIQGGIDAWKKANGPLAR